MARFWIFENGPEHQVILDAVMFPLPPVPGARLIDITRIDMMSHEQSTHVIQYENATTDASDTSPNRHEIIERFTKLMEQ